MTIVISEFVLGIITTIVLEIAVVSAVVIRDMNKKRK